MQKQRADSQSTSEILSQFERFKEAAQKVLTTAKTSLPKQPKKPKK